MNLLIFDFSWFNVIGLSGFRAVHDFSKGFWNKLNKLESYWFALIQKNPDRLNAPSLIERNELYLQHEANLNLLGREAVTSLFFWVRWP